MNESTLQWLKGASSLIGITIGIISLFGAAGAISVLFYRVGQAEKRASKSEGECELNLKELESKMKKETGRLHNRLDEHERENKPLRDALNSMKTDIKWIKTHIQALTQSPIPQDTESNPPMDKI